MRNLAKYILGACFGLLTACTSETVDSTLVPGNNGADDRGGVNITLAFPEIAPAGTRAFGDNPESLDKLHVFLFVFDGSQLLQTSHYAPQEDITVDAGRIKFTAYLPQTDNNATVHIVAIDDTKGEFAKQIDAVGYGLEDTVMPALCVTDGQDAYWQRVELGCRILVKDLDDIEGTEKKVNEKLHNVSLVRNFAKITLSEKDGGVPDFEILGWTVVNYLDSGSVVPWFSRPGNPDVEFPDYTRITDWLYNDITGQGFYGVSQAGATLVNPSEDLDSQSGSTMGEKWNKENEAMYIYERKAVSVNPLFILLYAKFDENPGYYKLALGHTDSETGLFTEYNVLRNIEYHIEIQAVTAQGAGSPAEAAAGPAFNNVSGDVTTRNMTTISDGVDMLYVNWVKNVITEKGKSVEFKFRYVKHINNPDYKETGNPNDEVIWETDEEYEVGIATGDVVKWYTLTGDVEDDKDTSIKWRTIAIDINDPTDEIKQQSFTIFTKPRKGSQETIGLSRTINLVLRNKWDFVRMETFPGLWDNDREWPDYDPDEITDEDGTRRYIGSQKGAQLTIFFELPAGLPEAIFPLDFTFESDRQNIENAGEGNAVVQTAPSLFEGVDDQRISFVKTVTWQDYAPDGISSTKASRIIRARFVTTTNIESLVDDAMTSTVILSNPNFNYIDDKFERDQYHGFYDDDAVQPTDMIWDVSSTWWSKILNEIGTGNRYFGTQKVKAHDGESELTVAQGYSAGTAGYYLSKGENADGESYILMRYNGNNLSLPTIKYPETNINTRVGVLKITAEEDDPPKRNAVDLRMTVTPSSVSTTNDNVSFRDGNKATRTYTFAIPANATDLNITNIHINTSAGTNNSALRIYKIEFYPFGEPQEDSSDSGDSAGD